MASTLSRRISEFLGVALFALALIWLISLVTYEPTDPVWFFTTEAARAPANFVGRVGAFLAELSFQLFGYASYLLPAVVGVIGWHYFWCQSPDAAYTKIVGVMLLFGCTSSFLSLAFGSTDVGGKTFHAGGSVGAWARRHAGRLPQSHRLDHRPADADDPVGHPLDAVLVRPDVRAARARTRATSRRAASAGSAPGSNSGARTSSGRKSSPSTRRRRASAAARTEGRTGDKGAAARPRAGEAAPRAGNSAGRRAKARRGHAEPAPRTGAGEGARRDGRGRSRCRRHRCSMRRRPSTRSTSAS